MIIEMGANISCPAYNLIHGRVYDLPSKLAKEILALKDAAGRPAATVCTDEKLRSKARPFRLNPVEQGPMGPEEGWIGGDANG